jgi:hypothetical protein
MIGVEMVNTNKGEPLFEDVDTPVGWSSYTFRPMFKPMVENISVMPILLVPVLFQLML